jgi:hypothetical protein
MNKSRFLRSPARMALVGALFLLASLGAAAQTAGTSGASNELYVLPWPSDAGWRQTSRHDNNDVLMIEYANGDRGRATETGSILRIPQARAEGVPLEKAVDASFQQLRRLCTDARLQILDRDTTGAHPWIIYMTTCPTSAAGKPETNVYQMIRGDAGVYICQRSFSTVLTAEAQQQMVAFFKGGKFVREN